MVGVDGLEVSVGGFEVGVGGFEVGVGGCKWVKVDVGGFRWFPSLVTTVNLLSEKVLFFLMERVAIFELKYFSNAKLTTFEYFDCGNDIPF